MKMDLESLYVRYGPMVLRRCRALLKDEELALETMQDTFVQLLKAGDSLALHAPSSFLYRTATHLCLNHIRTRKRHPETPGEELLLALACHQDLEERAVVRQLLGAVFGGVHTSTATMAVLHYVDGLTLEEVARTLSMSVSGVRKRLASLKTRVKLEEFHDEP
ncbi:RNA polymerase sigma factor [Myxococcota bacterium]|nr:RNA polymerase sigma factor [Myxococcota bacterium]MBU1534865.1 RNA polymerase sigma factor [Myxococcota bacterium]